MYIAISITHQSHDLDINKSSYIDNIYDSSVLLVLVKLDIAEKSEHCVLCYTLSKVLFVLSPFWPTDSRHYLSFFSSSHNFPLAPTWLLPFIYDNSINNFLLYHISFLMPLLYFLWFYQLIETTYRFITQKCRQTFTTCWCELLHFLLHIINYYWFPVSSPVGDTG